MALQFRRGTEAERDQEDFIPLVGEPIYTTDGKRLYIGDGSTIGGNPVGYNNDLSDLTDVELGYERTVPILSITAVDNIVTVITSSPHGLVTGDEIYLATKEKPSLNGIHEIVALGITAISFDQVTADFAVTPDSGALKFEPKDRSILAYDQQSGKWTDQSYIYRLRDLGDVKIQDPVNEDIIQYTSIPVGNVVDGEENIVEEGVEQPESLPEGLSWTETGHISKFVNKPFKIGVENLTDVLINESSLADNQILAYNSFLEVWINRDYVDDIEDLRNVQLTQLPDLSETQARVTLSGLWNELDTLTVQIVGVQYSYTLTEEDISAAYDSAITDQEFNQLIRAAAGQGVVELINNDEGAPVIASFANDVITLNPKSSPTNLNLVTFVVNNSTTDSRVPIVEQFEPINSQVLSYDGQKWTNKPLEINNFNLSILNDVNLDNVQGDDILQYDSVTGKWTNAPNFISLNQFADVEIINPSEGEALIYNEQNQKFITRKFILDDLEDVNDPSFNFSVPDGSILAYSEAEQSWKPQQFTTLSSRTEVSFNTGPLEDLQVTFVNFEAFTGYGLFKAKASAPCTVTLYVSQYEREIDADRPENEDPRVGRGIFAEFTITDGSYRRIAPVIYGFNDDVPIKRRAYAKVRNRSGYYQSDIEVTLTILQIEADPEQITEIETQVLG